MNKTVTLGRKVISEHSPAFVIAEAGVNHNGNPEMARTLIKEAHACKADCVKFQTYKAERVVTESAPKAKYQLGTTKASQSQLDMLREIELKPEYHRELKLYAEELGMVFLSTPYNPEDVELLESIGVLAYKVASGQIVEYPFLRKIAGTGKPIFLSTGMASLAEVDTALGVIRKEGNDQVILLQCTTNYPSQFEDANLRVLQTLGSTFGVLVGYSDHTVGDETAIAAVALGAKVIEKHFTLDKDLPGPDHSASMTPRELKCLVEKIRRVESSLGSGIKEPCAVEMENSAGMRRSITASCSISKGEEITPEKITFKRPATGLSHAFYDIIIGKYAARDILSDEQLQMDMIEWQKI